MTTEEWAVAYVLRFGREQLLASGYVEGEKEFFCMVTESLGLANEEGDEDAPWRTGYVAIYCYWCLL